MDSPSDQVRRGSNLRACDHERRSLERDFGLRIERDGTWTYLGSPIRRLPLVRLFATVLRREADGSYWLATPVEHGRIEVEDTPFVAVELKAEGEGESQHLHLRTNLDAWVTVDDDHPLRLRTPPWADRQVQDPVPYVDVRAGLEARLLRSVFYELVDLGREHELAGQARFGVWSSGRFFPLDEPCRE
jgi:uncharacterized protein